MKFFKQTFTSKCIQNTGLFFLLLLTFNTSVIAESLTASVTHNVVQMGQEIQFTLTLSDKSAKGEPDFSALNKDFDVLSGASRRSSKNYINGAFSSTNSWTVLITPKTDGSLEIPPISYAGLRSEAITVVVGKASPSAAKDVFFETLVSAKEVYVQAQLRLDLKLYIRKSNISNTNLDNLDSPDAQIIKIGKDRQSEVLKNGIAYFLIERSFYIYPLRSGKLEIPQINFNGVISEGSRFSNLGKRRRVNAQSETQAIKVLGIPDSFPKNATWLPAEDIAIYSSISPSVTVNTGDPITQTITTQAQGLYASALPPITAPTIAGVKIYPDQGKSDQQINTDTLRSQRIDSFAVIASEPGNLELPEISLPWWNTKTNELQYAKVQPQMLNITGASKASSVADNKKAASETEEEINLTLGNNSTQQVIQTGNTSKSIDWKIVLSVFFVMLLIWLATIAFFLRRIKLLQSSDDNDNLNPTSELESVSSKQIKQQIKNAVKAKDALALRTNLLAWAKVNFPEKPIQGLKALAQLLKNAEIDGQFKKIDDHLYSNAECTVEFDKLLQIFESASEEVLRSKKLTAAESGNALKSLFKDN